MFLFTIQGNEKKSGFDDDLAISPLFSELLPCMHPGKTLRATETMQKTQTIFSRLTWFGHVTRMNRDRIVKQVMNSAPEQKREREHQGKLAGDYPLRPARGLELTWEDALDASEDRDGWRRCITRCVALHRMD